MDRLFWSPITCWISVRRRSTAECPNVTDSTGPRSRRPRSLCRLPSQTLLADELLEQMEQSLDKDTYRAVYTRGQSRSIEVTTKMVLTA